MSFSPRSLPSLLVFIFLMGSCGLVSFAWAAKEKPDNAAALPKPKPTKAAAKPSQPAVVAPVPPQQISYNFQVRPILANACFKCHGMDEKARKGKLRLDNERDAYAKAIVPGKLEESEFWKRMITEDPEEMMPPPEAHVELKLEDRAVLREWILQGAKYDTHWAFKPIVKPQLPATAQDAWGAQEMDAFVLQKLREAKLEPAEMASRERWLKRVTMDLTGLPPTLADLETLLRDESKDAYVKVTERLLASPQFGERMANDWLDVARYADTYGRHEDADCDNSSYRDWAIQVFNQNLSYDKFIEWQIGGDMLPEATTEMRLATAFNRLHPQSNESGSDEEEFRNDIVVDRVKTMGTAFLGLSFDCARCHDHKYDPISMKDFYAFSAFLNNIDEQGLFSRFTNATPTPAMFLYAEGQEQQHQGLKKHIETKRQEIETLKPAAQARFQQWLASGQKPNLVKPTDHLAFEGKLKSGDLANSVAADRPANFKYGTTTTDGPAGKALLMKGDVKITWENVGDFRRSQPFSVGLWLRPEEEQKRAVVFHHTVGAVDAANRGYEFLLDDMRPDFCLAHFWPGNGVRIRSKERLEVGQWHHLLAVYDGTSKASGLHIYRNGVELECEVIGDSLTEDITYASDNGDLNTQKVMDAMISATVAFTIAGRRNDSGLANAYVDEIKVFNCALTAPEAKALAGRPSTEADWFAWYVREIDGPCKQAAQALQTALNEECDFTKQLKSTMVMRERTGPRRPTFLLERGRFDAKGAEVQPDVPASILPWPEELPRNRAGLAKWFTHPSNPLTSRVAVNRFWQIFFGRGLVNTSEDFGIQGALPSHPELLDWLAADFQEHGWNVKRLCRMIVLSATYRQSGRPRDQKTLAEDPENRLLARGPHHRWSAEQIRDQALAVSGLLVKKIGGPSVFPYQPPGLWEDSGTQHTYTQDKGDNLYRRSMYTFWRRTLPPPTMTIMDAPTREYCKVRREITTTPMQALALMNDPQLVECARVMAENLIRSHPGDEKLRLTESFRLWTGRKISELELVVLEKYYQGEKLRFKDDSVAASELIQKNGDYPRHANLSSSEVAALTMVQRVLLNLPETVIKY